jgi:hypothetical protein
MSHDKIKDAARRRMARTGESYATARRRVIAERRADDARVADAVRMGDPVLSVEEIRAAAAAHGELGPEYSDAVVASFLEKVEQEIDARVDARLGQTGRPEAPADQDGPRTLLKGIGIGIGIAVFAVAVVGGNPDERMHRLVVLLGVLAVIAVTCAVGAARAGRQLAARRGGGRQRPGVAVVPGHERRW